MFRSRLQGLCMFCSLNGSIARLSFLLLSVISIAACDSVDTVALPVNEAPTASSVRIIDNNGAAAIVGDSLTGDYIYADTENNAEGTSSYRWIRHSGVNSVVIGGATTSSYTLVTADIGQSITFEVTPVASIGTTNGSPITSSAIKVNSPPTATNISITDENGGIAVVGDTLKGSYSYVDIDDDLEGISTFRWLRNGAPIPSATSSTYILSVADLVASVTFEITPVAKTGDIIGSALISAGGITVNNSAPIAINVGKGCLFNP